MKIELWQSQEFDHAHEARALETLLTALQEQDWDVFCLVCANFYCAGEQIDLLVIKPHAIVVVELKETSGRIEGGENGDWLLTDTTGKRVRLNPGRRNPYQQARAMRYAVADFLSTRAGTFMPPQKAMQLDFMHVAAVVCFTEYDPSSILDLPHAPWFSAVGLDGLVEELRVRRSPRLHFSRKEATALVRDVLRLKRVQIEPRPVEILEAEPALVTEVPVTEAVAVAEREPDPAPCIVCGDEHTCVIPHLSGTLVSSSEGRPLGDLDLVVFDVETTGTDASAGDRVVEVAAIKVSKGVVISEFRELVHSGVPVGETVDVHGYTDEFLRKHGKPPAEVFPRFVEFVGEDILAAHNLPFDWSFVNSELALLGMPRLQNATIDTLSLARRLLVDLKKHGLEVLCDHFGIPLDDAHHALPDVNATWLLLTKLSRMVENAGGSVDPERTIGFASTEGRDYDIRMINQWAAVPQEVQLIRDSRVLGDQPSEVLVALHHLAQDPKNPHRLLAGHESLVVIEPDWLIQVTSLLDVGRCDREYLVNRFRPREPNEPMLVGALAHRCFEAILRDPEDEKGLGDAFYGGTRDLALDLITLGSNEESIAPSVRPHAKILVRWAVEMPFRGQRSPETFVFSPELGLKGVIDALWKDEEGHPTAVVELKTGSAPWYREPWEGHALQAGAYALMLIARDPGREIEPPIVLYTGGRQPTDSSGTEKIVAVTPEMAASVVAARNRVPVADYCLETPDSGIFPCPRCWNKEGCSILSLLADSWPEIEPPGELEPPSFDDEDRRFFRHYATLLAREYKAFKDSHQTLWKDDPKKREEEGTAVYVPEIGEPEAVEGGFLYDMPCDNRSELREGQFVLVSDGDVAGSSRLAQGTVIEASRAGITIRTGSRLTFDSAWLDSYSGERLLDSDFQSLYDWMISKSPTARRMVIGREQVPRFGNGQDVPFKPRLGDKPLNAKQKEALSRALAIEDYILIEGPPGSGKTVLIGALARGFFERGDRVLLAANTNQALDKAILALMDQGLGDEVVRLGSPVSVTDERVKSRLLEVLAASADRSHYVQEFKELVETTPVVAATVARWQTFPRSLAEGFFDVAIVDEATQISVPSALGVLRHLDKFVLLGDPNQLPPVVLHEPRDGEEQTAANVDSVEKAEASPDWPPLSRSLFEILLEKLKRAGQPDGIVSLEEQYRMNETICRFPSDQWYGGKLRPAAEAMGQREFPMLLEPWGGEWSEVLSPQKYVVIVDIPGSADAGYMPRTNAAEARVVSEIVLAARRAGVRHEDIAVITPYRAQVAWIRRQLEKHGRGILSGDQIRSMVDTVDRFQGEERPMVMVSFATYGRTLSDHLKNQRRLNVALTRAKHKLVLIGDRQILSQDDLYARLFSPAVEEDVHTIVKRWTPPVDEGFRAF